MTPHEMKVEISRQRHLQQDLRRSLHDVRLCLGITAGAAWGLIITVVCLLMAGCGWEPPAGPPPAGIERATGTVHPDFEEAWRMVGGHGLAPPIIIVEDEDLNCPEGGDRFVEPGLPGCWGGLHWPGRIIKVTRKHLWERLAHELRHAAKYQATGDADAGHGGLAAEAIRQWDKEIVGPAQMFLLLKEWR